MKFLVGFVAGCVVGHYAARWYTREQAPPSDVESPWFDDADVGWLGDEITRRFNKWLATLPPVDRAHP